MKSISKIAVMAGGLSVLLPTTGALAQGGAQGLLDEIMVTARKRTEALSDVPASITAFSADTLQKAGVQRVEDFIGMTPGVTLVDAAEVGDTQVNIRGINGARDAENSFAFILDGVLMTNPAAFNRELVDLQQIEIMKGPQGAIYGRNAAAGAIIVTTKIPSDEFEGSLRTSISEQDSYLVSGTVSGPLADGVAFRLSADWRDSKGFYKNSFLDAHNVDNFENYNVNGRLYFEPNENLTVDAKVRYGEAEGGAIAFNSIFSLPGFTGFNPLFLEDVNEHDFVFQGNVEPENNQESTEISVKVDYDFTDTTLTAWALYSDISQDLIADGTSAAFGFFDTDAACLASITDLFTQGVTLPAPQWLGPAPGFPNSLLGAYTPTTCDGYQYQARDQEDISLEIRLASSSDQAVQWLVGGYFLDIDREVGVATGIDQGGETIPNLFNGPGTSSPTEQLVHDQFDSTVFAAFGQLSYNPTDSMELSAALRYDHEKRKVDSLVPTTAVTQYIDFDGPPYTGGAPINPGLNPAINPSGVIDPKEKSFDQIQPKVSVRWDATEEWTVFGSWGVGFKSGGFNNSGASDTIDLFINGLVTPDFSEVQIDDVFKKETSSAFEVGFKGRLLDGRISIDGAFYHTTIDDMQFFEFFVGPFGLLRVVSNVDEVKVLGGELAINAVVTDWLSVFGGVNIIDSEIKKNASRPDTVGNKSPYTADYTVNLGAQVDYPLTDDVNFFARADWQLVGPTWFHTVQNQLRPTAFGPADYSLTERDSYNLLNLRLGVSYENWTITAFGRNVTNEDHLEEVIPAPEFGGAFIHPGSQSQWGGELTVRF